MPIPFLIGGAAVALGATGLVKGAKALSDMSDAEDIGSRAERKHRNKLKEVDEARQNTNNELARLGKLKIDIFSNQIKHVVDVVEKSKAKLQGFNEAVIVEQIPQLANIVTNSLELEKGLASGLASGVLVGMGAYGSVGMLATASTGTAISTLSGAAATNATLAWLGGGSLAAGGFGMAGGTLVLGGIVTAPALAVMGFMAASKAEEALTEATKYSANIDLKVDKLDTVITVLEGINKSAKELQYALLKAVMIFEKEYKVDENANKEDIARMGAFVKILLKPLLNEPVIKNDGTAVEGILARYEGQLKIAHKA